LNAKSTSTQIYLRDLGNLSEVQLTIKGGLY